MSYRARTGLGAVAPELWEYKVVIPILGEETVKIPVPQLVGDLLYSAEKELPKHLPQLYADLSPYLDQAAERALEYAEYEAPILGKKLLDKLVQPRIDKVVADAQRIKNEAVFAGVGIALFLAAAVGGAAWYVTKKR